MGSTKRKGGPGKKLRSNSGRESRAESDLPRVSQDDLAQRVVTTRSRVSHFMNKFRKLGFIDYSDSEGLTVHNGLLSVVLHEPISGD